MLNISLRDKHRGLSPMGPWGDKQAERPGSFGSQENMTKEMSGATRSSRLALVLMALLQ